MSITVRPALPRDVAAIHQIVEPYAERGILLAKELVDFYEAVQEFWVAEIAADALGGADWAEASFPAMASPGKKPLAKPMVVGCGAIHVMWEDLAEVRTLAVAPAYVGQGIGHQLLARLLARARELELRRVFCLTFEVDFFRSHGFTELPGPAVPEPIFGQLLRSHDDGVAEFLELTRVKANTLGNTRMLLRLPG